jgi:hypothetical protein
MKRMLRMLAVVGSLAMVTPPVPALAHGHPGAELGPSVRVDDVHLSQFRQKLAVVTGSDQFVVYANHATKAFSVADRDGHRGRLGYALHDVSEVGGMVTAQWITGDGKYGVQWWNLPEGTRGSVLLHSEKYALAAAPGGWITYDKPDLYVETPDGDRTLLVANVRTSPFPFPKVHSGPKGAIFSPYRSPLHPARHPFKYVPFDQPRHVVVLRYGGSKTVEPVCHSVNAIVAACASKHTVAAVELDGGKSRVIKTPLRVGAPFLIGERLFWRQYPRGHRDGSKQNLMTATAAGNSRRVATIALTRTVQSALGEAVAVRDDGHGKTEILASLDADGKFGPTIRQGFRLPSRVLDPVLTPGHARWTALMDRTPHGAAINKIWQSRLGDTNQPDSAAGNGALIAASGATLLTQRQGFHRTLTLRTPLSSGRIRALPFVQPEVSGNRVVYGYKVNHETVGYRLFDGSTGKTVNVGVQRSRDLRVFSHHPVALAGNRLAYVKDDGAVIAEDLSGGQRTTLLPRSSRSARTVDVYASGAWVGWNSKGRSGWRDADTMGRIRRLPKGAKHDADTRRIVSLTTNGVLWVRHKDTGAGRRHSAYFLEPYQGGDPLLVFTETSRIGHTPAPSVVADRMAWGSGGLLVTPLPHVANAPRYLGAAIAPTRSATGHMWHADVPYGAALSQCEMSFTKGDKLLATVPCDESAVADGDALVNWKASTSGTIHWRLDARNADGPAVLADGSVGDVRGTIAVS